MMGHLSGFEFESAKSKKQRDDDDAPTQMSMRPEKLARNPSTDQKKVRRQMARQAALRCPTCNTTIGDDEQSGGSTVQAGDKCPDCGQGTLTTKESSRMDTSTHREAMILAAMAKATLDEQRQLAADLNDLRMARAAKLAEERDSGIANAFIRDTLTPVATHVLHTASTDWIDEVADYGSVAPESMTHEAVAEATTWFNRTHAAVRADREEFAEQAMGMARRTASKFGPFAPAARKAFLDRVATLHAADRGTSIGDTSADNWPLDDGQKEQQPNTEDWDARKTTGDSRDFSQLPGVASSLDDEFAFVAASDLTDPVCGSPGDNGRYCGLPTGHGGAHDYNVTKGENDKMQREQSRRHAADQSGNASSGLPLEPQGDTDKTFDEIINGDLESTGPVEVPSTRSPVIQENKDGSDSKRNQHDASLQVTAARSLGDIADEVAADWKNVYFGAVPYLQAMADLDSINDTYGADDARMIVNYFLSNATSWRGETAKRVKAELKAMLKEPRGRRAARGDYDHWNEEADQVWWQEEGRHGSEPPEDVDDGYMEWDGDEDEEDDEEWTHREPAGDSHAASRRQAAAPIADQSGQAQSDLDDVEVGDEDDRPMWPWEIKESRRVASEGEGSRPSQEEMRKEYDRYVSQGYADSDGFYAPLSYEYWRSLHYPGSASVASKVASEGQECGECGAAIEKDPAGENPSTWHHNDGSKHDHEATPARTTSSRRSPVQDAFFARVNANLRGAR